MTEMSDEDELRMRLMNAQLEETLARTERFRQELRWEPWKALAALIGAAAIFLGGVLALANWIGSHPPAPQPPIVIQLQTPK
jgi:hypothetical protein